MRRIAAAVIVAVFATAPSVAAGDVLVAGDRLWLVSDDGATRTPLPGPAGRDPAWSFDGRFAVTAGDADDEDTWLQIGRFDSAERLTLAGSHGLRNPSWSADGRSIVASRLVDAGSPSPRSELVVIPSTGGPPRVLTTGAYDVDPAWSPGGSEIAFARASVDPGGGPAKVELMAIRPDGSGLRTIAAHGEEPAWSPDGSRLAFASARDANGRTCFHECTPNREVYVVGAYGAGERRLTNDPADDHSPAWSPDATRIAFASDRHYPAGRFPEVFAMDADGACVTQLTLGTDEPTSPAWWPATAPAGRGPCGARLAPFYDGVDLRRVRVRHARPLFLGRAFEGMLMTRAEDGAVAYDECDRPDPRTCLGEIQIGTFTTCTRNPGRLDVPAESAFRLRGALVLDYDDRYEVLSGGTATVLYSVRSRALLRRMVAALRPTAGGDAVGALPAPRLPPRAWRRLRHRTAPGGPALFPGGRAAMRASDRRVLRVLRSFGRAARERPACAR